MKTRFSTYDLVCSVTELQKLIGMRVGQVYDIDHKTYLLKLQEKQEKCVLLLESGNRIHTTAFEWPKNVAPSGFSMKMRKHLRNKRLESLQQLGIDRILDLQFGSEEAAYHVILELYDRGNIVLTDFNYIILYILRPHVEGEEVRFAVKERYPVERARQSSGPPSSEKLKEILQNAKQGEPLKKVLNPVLEYGPAVIDHCLLSSGFPNACKIGRDFNINEDTPKLLNALNAAETMLINARNGISKGYILQKKEKRPLPDGTEEDFFTNQEFHPYIFAQHKNTPVQEYTTFDVAVDEFFSTLESQKIDVKALQQEKEAMKKLSNVRKDHEQRLLALEKTQESDKQRAELITRNQELVDNAILAVRTALASQASWSDIQTIVDEEQAKGNPVALCIKGLKLHMNHITLKLSDPYIEEEDSDDDCVGCLKPMLIDIDLDLTAFANARKYYDQKRNAAKKQQKTIESQGKALKSAERKTKQTLKEVQAITTINKARKVYWFEKFHWFISSENYLVIGGRDPQQNELIVKRYLRPGDVYVHADIQGASSIVIKNPAGQPVPPKTLNEAGVMAMCYSVAWDAKVVTSAWWVNSDQVSKTAPTGEYLTTGAFMIRGKKNFLPPAHLIMGFSFLFKLEDGSISRHLGERKPRGLEDEVSSLADSINEMPGSSENDQEIAIEDDSDDNEQEDNKSDIASPKDNEDDGENSKIKEETSSSDDSEEENSSKETQQNLDNPLQTVEFPDVEIKIEHNKFDMIKLHTQQSSLFSTTNNSSKSGEEVIFLGDDKPIIVKSSNSKQRKDSSSKPKENATQSNSAKETFKSENQQPKRGQKSKLKKIKEKYKYQDEEEKRLRMEILQPAGSGKEKKKGKKNRGDTGKGAGKIEKKTPPVPKPVKVAGDDSDGEPVEEVLLPAEVDMLDSLTGCPVIEDELLFAIPVVAPYNTLVNYKFKVKLTPGTGKRGKAAKTALNMFLKDRATLPREKDLIKSVKDEDLARNIPGKVKLSAPQLQKLRK